MFGAGEQTGADDSCTRADAYVDGLVRAAIPPGRHPQVPVFVVPPPGRAVPGSRRSVARLPCPWCRLPVAGASSVGSVRA